MPDTPPVRLLLVEDEFLVRLTLVEALTDEGYEVAEAASGDEAMGALQDGSAIALMLTDIQLPGSMNGRELARRARQAQPDLPIIFMTGRPESMGSEATSARDMFIAKPYLPSEICAAVQRMLAPAA